jgi:hypothetical protein
LRALAAWVTSDFDAAALDALEAAAEAERADDAMTRGFVCGWAAIFGAVRRDREQGARAFELRAALSLARLYQSTDSPLEADDVLAPRARRFFADPGIS